LRRLKTTEFEFRTPVVGAVLVLSVPANEAPPMLEEQAQLNLALLPLRDTKLPLKLNVEWRAFRSRDICS
jgi:hypothetical protein